MIRKATQFDLEAVTMLAMRLWPEQARAELEPEFATLLDGDEAAVFLLFADGKAAGFAHCQLRHDYVEGTDSSPVGYLEGIYVEEALRRRGHARALLAACETWAAEPRLPSARRVR